MKVQGYVLERRQGTDADRIEILENLIKQMATKQVTNVEPKDRLNGRQVQCNFCGEVGHWERDCRARANDYRTRQKDSKCHYCGRFGHFERECRTKANHLKIQDYRDRYNRGYSNQNRDNPNIRDQTNQWSTTPRNHENLHRFNNRPTGQLNVNNRTPNIMMSQYNKNQGRQYGQNRQGHVPPRHGNANQFFKQNEVRMVNVENSRNVDSGNQMGPNCYPQFEAQY